MDWGSPKVVLLAVLSISSMMITQFSLFVCFKASIIFPGRDPIYVFLCPFNTLTSFSPPKDILYTCLLRTLAIEKANEVLPTPGGPLRQSIFPFTVFFILPTAKNSKILAFTSFNPSWSYSKMSLAFSRSKFS